MISFNKISSQVIVLVFVALTIFGAGVALMVGMQTYYDFKVMAYERIDVSLKMFESEIENNAVRTLQSLNTVSENNSMAEQFSILNNFGPYFSEDPSSIGESIPDSDTTFYLQSQLTLSQHLLNILHQHNLTSLTIYHKDPFNQHTPDGYPLPSLRVTSKELIIYRYASKESGSSRVNYRLPIDRIIQDRDLFDISSVYQETADHFYQEIGAEKHPPSIEHNFKTLDISSAEARGYSISALEDTFNIFIWSPVSINLTNPNTWNQEKKDSLILVGQLQPSPMDLKQISSRLGTELSIVSDETVYASSLPTHTKHYIKNSNLEIGQSKFLYSEKPLTISNSTDKKFKFMAFTPVSVLKEKVIRLFFELTIFSVLAIIITALSVYLLIKKTLRSPLELLLEGVENVKQGNLSYQVQLNTNNELSKLARAFNRMTTEIRAQSEELQLMNDSLEQKVKERTEELKDAQQQLIVSEKMASLGQLVTGVAHEINTPLGISITSVSYNKGLHDEISAKFKSQQITSQDFEQFLSQSEESLDLTEKNLTRTKKLIDTFKKVSVDQSTDEASCFCISDCIEEVFDLHTAALETKNISAVNSVNSALTIISYKNFFFQVISSLIINIIDHAFEQQEDKRIEITSEITEVKVKILVHDNGKGMDQETLKKLFDPFFTTRRGTDNTGLGMYTCFNIVTQKLEGEIIADSTQGEGSTIIITLPLESDSSPEKIDIWDQESQQ